MLVNVRHLQGAPIKNNPLEKCCNLVMVVWISAKLSDFVGSILATYAVNFIQIIGMVQQIQHFEL